MCSSLVRGIADAVRSGQARFDLVLGPRGAGKSHLLGLVEGRLREELEGRAVIAGLPEEFHPSSLVHLLAEILRSLPPDPIAGPVEQQLAILAASAENARDRAVGMIGARLQELPLVIVVENLDVVLAAIGRDGQHQLRSILQTERRWSIVASSRSRAPSLFKESEPFFGTFVPWTLEPLSAEGCREMLIRLAQACGRDELARELETPKGLARVQTLRHVLGGHPRAMAFIFPHLHHDHPDAVERALGDLAEELTPYFQEQMSRLPFGQRPIAELLAEHWTPLSVGEIARATFNSQPTVSTYLRRLREDAIVRSTKLGREHFYEISDPLFRIARAMKRDDLRAKTFLRVLQSWYEFRRLDVWRLPPDQLQKLVGPLVEDNDHIQAALAPAFEHLRKGRFQRAFDVASAIDCDHSLRVAYQIFACSSMGDDERAFDLLASRPLNSTLVTSGVASLHEHEELGTPVAAGSRPACTKHPLLARRFCTALVAIQLRPPPDALLPSELEALEQPLRSESWAIRRTATETLLHMLTLVALAKRREFDACGRLLALVEPVSTDAMSFNLGVVVISAWAAERLASVFDDAKGALARLSPGLGPLARLGMELVAVHLGSTIDRGALTALLKDIDHEGKPLVNHLTLANGIWRTVMSVMMLPVFTMLAKSELLEQWLADKSPEHLRAVATMVHEGVLHMVAADKDLTPVMSALSLESRLNDMLGIDATMVPDPRPDVVYARLAAPERAAVRLIAAALGLEERREMLRTLSNDVDDDE